MMSQATRAKEEHPNQTTPRLYLRRAEKGSGDGMDQARVLIDLTGSGDTDEAFECQ